MMAREHVQMTVRQQPQRAQVVQETNPKNRKPIDPPPIIELKYDEHNNPHNEQWLVSPRTFMMVTMIDENNGGEPMAGKHLIGQTVSSLHRLKDINNKDGGFFVFGDISARKLGTYRLRFSLFDTDKDSEQVMFLGSVDSERFSVVPQRDFGSMSESTHLTRTFSDQGVKLRVRKDNRAITTVGQKRSFNASPPDASSPPMQYSGGAVQDHHYGTSAHSPATKRHRSGSEYDSGTYQTSSLSDTGMSYYSSTIPSSQRGWTASEQPRLSSNYPQQTAMAMPLMSQRTQGMSVQTPPAWSGYTQQSTLPSPTPSSHHHQPYPPSTSQQHSTAGMFGDPGTQSMSRLSYSSGYSYSIPSQQFQDFSSNLYPSDTVTGVSEWGGDQKLQ